MCHITSDHWHKHKVDWISPVSFLSTQGNGDKYCCIVYKWDLANFQLWGAVFQKEPPLPPSPAQATVRCLNPMSNKSVDSHTYLQTFKSLFTNRSFVLLLVSYGVNAGVFYAMSPLLNQIVLLHFEVSSAGTACNIPAYLHITPSDLALFLQVYWDTQGIIPMLRYPAQFTTVLTGLTYLVLLYSLHDHPL